MRLQTRYLKDGRITVTAYDPKKVGAISIVPRYTHGRELAQVLQVNVRPGHKRQGIGTKLYEAAAQVACDIGMPLASSPSWMRSPDSSGFWEKQAQKGRAQDIGDGVFVLDGNCDSVDLSGLGRAPESYFGAEDLLGMTEGEPDFSHVPEPEGEQVYAGRYVTWYGHSDYVTLVPVERIAFTEGNLWYPGHAAALTQLALRREATFAPPAARLYRVEAEDVQRSQQWYEDDELEYQTGMVRPWGPEDVGTYYVQLLDGNHRALAALAAGESVIPVAVGANYRDDVREDEWLSGLQGAQLGADIHAYDGIERRMLRDAILAHQYAELGDMPDRGNPYVVDQYLMQDRDSLCSIVADRRRQLSVLTARSPKVDQRWTRLEMKLGCHRQKKVVHVAFGRR